ncbi:MAG: hypothetical protein RBR15_00835 [Sphaerochaeta sp.]|nr:hypothetical protein [Sphaerochaeta sp.]
MSFFFHLFCEFEHGYSFEKAFPILQKKEEEDKRYPLTKIEFKVRIGHERILMEKQYIVLKINDMGYRTRDLRTGKIVSIKSPVDFKTFELDTITLEVEKEWEFKKASYVSGTVIQSELILENLHVPPLEYTKVNIHAYEFKDYTGYGFFSPNSDPVFEATEMESKKRYDALARLWEKMPQCIDALVHMGSMNFDSSATFRGAFNCFRGAIYIAEQRLPLDDEAQFPWSYLNNRPYLRALLALSCWYWKNENFDEAALIAKKILHLNPKDNQGARFLLEALEKKEVYRPDW